MNRRTAASAVLVLGLSCLLPMASASAAGPGSGSGRGSAPLICPGDTSASPFAISLASRAWSAASEVGGHRVLVPTSFAVASFTGDRDDLSSYALVDARVAILAAKGSADNGATACVVDGTQEEIEGGFTAVVVNGTLLP
jgi:hypothetical protein